MKALNQRVTRRQQKTFGSTPPGTPVREANRRASKADPAVSSNLFQCLQVLFPIQLVRPRSLFNRLSIACPATGSSAFHLFASDTKGMPPGPALRLRSRGILPRKWTPPRKSVPLKEYFATPEGAATEPGE